MYAETYGIYIPYISAYSYISQYIPYISSYIAYISALGMRIFSETLKRSETFRKFPKKRSETFRNFPIYGPSTWLLKLKNACIYDRNRKECTFTLCSYPDLFAHISRGMKYPALPACPGLMRLMRHTSSIY